MFLYLFSAFSGHIVLLISELEYLRNISQSKVRTFLQFWEKICVHVLTLNQALGKVRQSIYLVQVFKDVGRCKFKVQLDVSL